MNWVERIAEEKIRRAMDAGLLDNLAYSHRKVVLEPENPHLPRDMWAAFHVLETHNLLPFWMEYRRAIQKAIQEWRQTLRALVVQFGHTLPYTQEGRRHQQRMHTINEHIRDYQLIAPSWAAYIPYLEWDEEVNRVQSQFQS